MRLLYLPLEGSIGDQVAPRAAFEELLQRGALQAYGAYSFLVRSRELGSWDAMLAELLVKAKEFEPDAIFWELQTSGRVPKEFTKKLKDLPSHPVIAQRTGDSYWRPPKNMVEFGREIDLTFLSGSTLIPEFVKFGCKDVRLLPERLDTIRMCKPWNRTHDPDFDVVLIANCYRQLWFRRFPGQTDRIKLVQAFSKKFGKRFGLFGRGWQGEPCWQGVTTYEEQQVPMRNSRIVLGVNNWNHAHYFSDRLLNSLSSGVPVLYKYFPGAEEFFQDNVHLRYFRQNNDAVRIALEMLNNAPEKLEAMAKAGGAIAIQEHSTLRRTEQLVEALTGIRH